MTEILAGWNFYGKNCCTFLCP